MNKYLIQPQSGIQIDVNKGQKIEIIDADVGGCGGFLRNLIQR